MASSPLQERQRRPLQRHPVAVAGRGGIKARMVSASVRALSPNSLKSTSGTLVLLLAIAAGGGMQSERERDAFLLNGVFRVSIIEQIWEFGVSAVSRL